MHLHLLLTLLITMIPHADIATPAPNLYRSPDGVFESIVPEGWSAPSTLDEISTSSHRYQISFVEAQEIKAYFQVYFYPTDYFTVNIVDGSPGTLEAGLNATYHSYPGASAVSRAMIGTHEGYKVTIQDGILESEVRFIETTPGRVALVQFSNLVGASDRFASVRDALFANVKVTPENLRTPTPVATSLPLSSQLTDLNNGQTVHLLGNTLELRLPQKWTISAGASLKHALITIGDVDDNYGTFEVGLTELSMLDRSGRNEDLEHAFQSYIEFSKLNGFTRLGTMSQTTLGGRLAHTVPLYWADGRQQYGEYRVTDIGNGELLFIAFTTTPSLFSQLMPVYESLLDQLVIHPEYLLTPTVLDPTLAA